MSLSATNAHSLLEALNRRGSRYLLEAFDALGASEDVVKQLRIRLKRAVEQECELGSHYAYLFSWLVVRVGPRLGTSYELFEDEVANGNKNEAPVVMPRWTLATPMTGALQRRMPCRPFVEADDTDLARAYGGLLDHLVFVAALPAEKQRLEMLNTVIPWRIVAIADKLEPEAGFNKEPIATRLKRLKRKTVDDVRNVSSIEKYWWQSLNGALCSRRHALSHLGDSDGWTFSRCVDATWTIDEARAAAAGIGLAVMDHIMRSLRDIDPPTSVMDAVMDDHATAWLDECADVG